MREWRRCGRSKPDKPACGPRPQNAPGGVREVGMRAVLMTAAIAVGSLFTTGQPAECSGVFCTPVDCYSSWMCGDSCKCLRKPPDSGECVSLEVRDELLALGWEEL